MSEDAKEFVFKIVVLGDAAVGKTSLINMYIEQSFTEDYKPTLGANIIRKDVHVDEINASVRLIMWDLAGQEKYNVIRSMYFQGCVGALLVYDVTRSNTFEAIDSKWLKDFKKYVKKEGTYILIGNKVDLKDERVVSTDQGKNYANEIEASDFIETSAKYGENVEQAFTNLVHQILKNLGEIH
ncbi:MAG: GTP-binding protein [Promethearchaeota archaeon]|nr:MAG: GTP-binding protein [Candidatus Lokiarchaeota archaeon]